MTRSSQLVEADVLTSTTHEIEVELLFVSPDETRKTIDPQALAELAETIRTHGVYEPLIVRPMGKPSNPKYEIVSGQRRWLASKLAEKEFCPCIVREMTDEEARRLRITSNLQREGLPPMEEAEAYGKLMAEPGATVETVAAELAKSPSYIGRRLALLRAIEQVRAALNAGAIEVGHALELARLDEARQRQMLSRMGCGVTLVEPEDVEDESGEEGTCRFCGCTEEQACDGGCSWANEEQTVCNNPDCLEQFRTDTGQQNDGWSKTHYSVVELRREIAETSHVDLKDAPFPLFDEIAPMACTECPKRAGNAQLLFDDCAQDTCTDRGCFNGKVKLWIEAELAAAKSEKRKLLKVSYSWTSAKDEVHCSDYGPVREMKSALECEHGQEGIWIDGRSIGKRVHICSKADCKTHHGRSSSSGSSVTRSQSSPKQQAERKELLARVKAEKVYRAALFTAIAQIPAAKLAGQVFTRLLSRVVLFVFDRSDSTKYPAMAEAMGVPSDIFGWNSKKLEEHIAGLPDQVKALFAYMAIENGELTVHEHDVPGGGAMNKQKKLDLETLAEIVGVDWKALRAPNGEPDVKPAKAEKTTPVKKAAPAKKKSVLSAAAKKRIADAQRTRWAQTVKPAVKKVAKAASKKPAKAVAKKAAKKKGAR